MHSTPTLQGSSASFHTIDLNVWVLFLGIPLCLLKSLSIKQQLEAFFVDEKNKSLSTPKGAVVDSVTEKLLTTTVQKH
jgi:hypothetical protein